MNTKSGVSKKILVALLVVFIADIATLIYTMMYGPHPEFLPGGKDPTAYRILFIHVPCSWSMYVAFTLAFIGSILYLWRGHFKYDTLAYTGATLGVLYGIGGIVTGALWAAEVWGSPWNWDPKQTSTLILLLAYVGYLALRASIREMERMRTISSTYAIAAFVTLPISYVSSLYLKSLHEALPRQPLPSEAYMWLGIRIITAFILFIIIEAIYYLNVKSKIEMVEGS